MVTSAQARPLAQSRARTLVPALVAMALGLFVTTAVGFVGADALHNAVHDSRHAFAFPCH